jgi:Ni,Fe-hydrogenase maturation factor
MPSACTSCTNSSANWPAIPSIDCRETTEMGLALLDFITGYRAVAIVDSIQTGKEAPGFLHELDASRP